MELWDAYDKDFNKIEGVVLKRKERIPEGVYHLVSDIIVRHRDGEYLIVQRDARKHFGGMWEATAGGSALKGETAEECAYRELREETGIEADKLIEIKKFPWDPTRCYYVEYLCVTDCDKQSVILQEGETVAYKWASADEICSMSPEEMLSERMQEYIKSRTSNL